MPNLDAHVASVLDANNLEDEDRLIAELEASEFPALDARREQRIQQLHAEFVRAKEQEKQGFGKYTELTEEKTLMDLITEVTYAVVHFAKDDFNRCGVMDNHLQAMAPKHFDTRFLKIAVENAPFLVSKLNVKVLPCILAFVNGVSVDRIVGFEELGLTPDNFATKDLEARFLASGVIQRAKSTRDHSSMSLASKNATIADVDNDEDD